MKKKKGKAEEVEEISDWDKEMAKDYEAPEGGSWIRKILPPGTEDDPYEYIPEKNKKRFFEL